MYSVYMQQIREIITTKSSKLAIHKNLDPLTLVLYGTPLCVRGLELCVLAASALIHCSSSIQMVFIGHGFTSGGQELGSVFSASVCIIQASKCYVESLPLVLKDRRS